MATWAMTDAKAKFSELIDKAVNHEPQEVTRNGKSVVMIVSREDWLNRHPASSRPRESLIDFFRNSPLIGSGIDLRRKRATPRKVGL